MDFPVGRIWDPHTNIVKDELFSLTIEDLTTHVLLGGSTGSGKSRTARQLAIDAVDSNFPCFLIDIHGDTADDAAAALTRRITENGERHLLSKLHYIEFSPFYCPRLDPLALTIPSDAHPEFRQNLIVAAREAAIDQVATHFNSTTQGTESFEGTARLLRNLKNGVAGCAVPCPRVRLPLGCIEAVLNPSHERHEEVHAAIAPFLPPNVRADFRALHQMENVVKQREQMESSQNRTSAFLSSLLREVFGETAETAPVLDWATALRKRHAVFVNLRHSRYFSHQQGVVMARLFFSQIIETMMQLPRGERPDHAIVILEESGEVITEPCLRYLGAVRKYGARMIFCGQDFSTFRKPHFDMIPKLLSQCGTFITYNQGYPDDAELMCPVTFQSSIDWTKLTQNQEFEGELEWLQVKDSSTGTQRSTSKQVSRSTAKGRTNGASEGTSDAIQEGWSAASTRQEGQSDGMTSGITASSDQSQGFSQSPILEDGRVKELLDLASFSGSQSEGRSDQQSSTRSVTTGEQFGTTGSDTHTVQKGTNWAESTQETEGTSDGTSEGTSESKSTRWVHIPHKNREEVETGQLRAGPSAEQLERFKTILMELPARHAIVKRRGKPPVFIRSIDVPDPYMSESGRHKALQWLKRTLLGLRPYLFVPNLDPRRDNERIDAFLRQQFEHRADDPLMVDGNDVDDQIPFGI